MNRLLSTSAVLGFVLILGAVTICFCLSARAGGAAVASQNGDVNGDGTLDIADAVYTLSHLFNGGPAPVECASKAVPFDDIFSIPRTPQTQTQPGQAFSMDVPPGARVLITDIRIENLGGGASFLIILEQKLPNSFEVRYVISTRDSETTDIHFTTGLRLGDESPINGKIEVRNDSASRASVLARLNGVLVR